MGVILDPNAFILSATPVNEVTAVQTRPAGLSVCSECDLLCGVMFLKVSVNSVAANLILSGI